MALEFRAESLAASRFRREERPLKRRSIRRLQAPVLAKAVYVSKQ